MTGLFILLALVSVICIYCLVVISYSKDKLKLLEDKINSLYETYNAAYEDNFAGLFPDKAGDEVLLREMLNNHYKYVGQKKDTGTSS